MNPEEAKKFFKAAQYGNLETIQEAIKSGIDVNAKSEGGNTALIIASANFASSETVEAIIKAGADVNAKNTYGLTPLTIAPKGGHSKSIDLLKKVGAI